MKTITELRINCPLLYQALLDMGMDNGYEKFDATYMFFGLDVDVLRACEEALDKMSGKERQTIVCGEHTDQQDIIVKYGLNAYVLHTFLFLVFDGPYSGVYK